MSLHQLLLKQQAKIAKQWFGRTVETYSPEASLAFTRQKNPFDNPVGHTLAKETAAIVALLIEGSDPEELRLHLLPIIRMRAVQEFTPAQAISFVYLLKLIIREELASELDGAGLEQELWHFEMRIDRMALLAFDIYSDCQRILCDVRLNEMKRNVANLWKRAFGDVDVDPSEALDPNCSETCGVE
ncbi:MAG: RsbRD N-terminal domain-containing protein [Proteobacteria bacterium]|jgi:hypothetical protein|nr:RsbRD N-terminal domain-containing protein [Pseudomonadota bacterium]